MSMRDRSNGVDNAIPFRPLALTPARNGTIGTGWHNPRGVRMFWRSKYSNGTTTTNYPAWNDTPNIVSGPLSPVGGTVTGTSTGGRTLTVNYDITGRVIPFEWKYTVRKVSATGSVSTTVETLSVTGPGEYTLTISAVANGSAQVLASGNQGQFEIPDN